MDNVAPTAALRRGRHWDCGQRCADGGIADADDIADAGQPCADGGIADADDIADADNLAPTAPLHGLSLMTTKPYLTFAAIFLLGLGLRLYDIGAQSLWYDEGLTVALVQRAPAEIVRAAAADIHPPLYYLLLKAWVAVFGTSEAAVRSFSALCGAITAVFTTQLGRRWFGDTAGALAGLAAAVSPLGVYYGQEARMYALASLLAVLLWLALDLWRVDPARRWMALYALAALAGLLTHYFFVTVVAAAAIVGLLAPHAGATVALVRPASIRTFVSSCLRGPKLVWLVLHAALAAVYLPLAWGSRSTLVGWTTSGDTPGPLLVVLDALRTLALGPGGAARDDAMVAALRAVAPGRGALAGAGAAVAARNGRDMAATPGRGAALLSIGQPYYKPRFLMPVLPAFNVLLGAGAVALATRMSPRRHEDTKPQRTDGYALERGSSADEPQPSYTMGIRDRIPDGTAFLFPYPRAFVPSCLRVIVLLLLLAAAQPLLHTYFDPRARRDDYRAIAQSIIATARPGDAVLLTGPGQVEPLGYYLHTPLARYPLPRARPLDQAATERELEALARNHQRVYGVFYVPQAADPQSVITGWLARNAFRAASRWYGGVELVVYELGNMDAPATPLDAHFGAGLRLLDAQVGPVELHPDDALRAELRWRTNAPLGPLLVFAHLLDAHGRLVAQFDGPPAADSTETWAEGQEQRGRLAILVPPDTAPGIYHLVLGVYDPAGTRFILPGGGDTIVLSEVRVTER